jgi:alpha-L-fucosidase
VLFRSPWESCITLGTQWSWKPNDQIKTLKECLDILVRCAAGDGNLALNTNPMPDGQIEPRQVERFREIGAWLKQYGQSVYGTRGGPYKPMQDIASTSKGNTVYIHVLKWSGDTITLPNLPKKVLAASLLTGGTIEVKQDDRRLTIQVPAQSRQEIDTIVKLDLNGPALDIPPLN